MAHQAGFEPTTPAFGGRYSIQLSYWCVFVAAVYLTTSFILLKPVITAFGGQYSIQLSYERVAGCSGSGIRSGDRCPWSEEAIFKH